MAGSIACRCRCTCAFARACARGVTRALALGCRGARSRARAGVDVGTGGCLAFKLDFHGAGIREPMTPHPSRPRVRIRRQRSCQARCCRPHRPCRDGAASVLIGALRGECEGGYSPKDYITLTPHQLGLPRRPPSNADGSIRAPAPRCVRRRIEGASCPKPSALVPVFSLLHFVTNVEMLDLQESKNFLQGELK